MLFIPNNSTEIFCPIYKWMEKIKKKMPHKDFRNDREVEKELMKGIEHYQNGYVDNYVNAV